MFLTFETFLFASVWTRNLLIGATQYTNSPSTNKEANIQKHPQLSLKFDLIYGSYRNVNRGSSLSKQALIQRAIRMQKSSGEPRYWLELHCVSLGRKPEHIRYSSQPRLHMIFHIKVTSKIFNQVASRL